MADSMITDGEDYLGALQVLHPKLSEIILQQFKKMRRQIETLDLKQAVNNDEAQEVKILKKVNREMKKQLECYK